jgi:alpha-glucoside transport system permease protein
MSNRTIIRLAVCAIVLFILSIAVIGVDVVTATGQCTNAQIISNTCKLDLGFGQVLFYILLAIASILALLAEIGALIQAAQRRNWVWFVVILIFSGLGALIYAAARPTEQERRGKLLAWLWIGPAVLFAVIFLVYPVITTIIASFQNKNSTAFVGFQNFQKVFTDPGLLLVLRNNVLWLILATAGTVFLGLIIAVLVDRVRIESFVKSTIFIPMALSMTAAAVIWRFVYAYAQPGQPQIGLLNAIITGLGGQPQGFTADPKNDILNNVLLMVAYVWMWTGFCMVILSAALKSIPTEILEAARVDGASELSIFFRITMPMITPTIAVVATTMLINVLKIFDIVYVMTGGDFKTDVVAVDFYQQYFNFNDFGVGSALAVLLLVAIIPIMAFNIRRFRVQEAQR